MFERWPRCWSFANAKYAQLHSQQKNTVQRNAAEKMLFIVASLHAMQPNHLKR